LIWADAAPGWKEQNLQFTLAKAEDHHPHFQRM
jgi:hypothetical protein